MKLVDMYEDAQKIFDYLPIEAGQESIYIQHLSGAFQTLIKEDTPIREFAIIPFHLLFMFAIQYKVYRISAYKQNDYLEILKKCKLYDKGHEQVLKNNSPIIGQNGYVSSNCSVKNLSLIPEKQIFDFFKIINVGDNILKKAKDLVTIRGTYAHANGNIEENIEEIIGKYINVLQEVQKCMWIVNKNMYNWVNEIEEGEFPLDYFFMERFLHSQFSKEDFGDIIHTLLSSEELDFDQWQQVVNKGLEISYDKTILSLLEISKNKQDEGKMFNVIRVLYENSEIDEGMKNDILKNENDQDIIELLNN